MIDFSYCCNFMTVFFTTRKYAIRMVCVCVCVQCIWRRNQTKWITDAESLKDMNVSSLNDCSSEMCEIYKELHSAEVITHVEFEIDCLIW